MATFSPEAGLFRLSVFPASFVRNLKACKQKSGTANRGTQMNALPVGVESAPGNGCLSGRWAPCIGASEVSLTVSVPEGWECSVIVAQWLSHQMIPLLAMVECCSSLPHMLYSFTFGVAGKTVGFRDEVRAEAGE